MSDSTILAIGDPGRAPVEIGPGAPTFHPDSADHELTECAVPGAQVRAASVRGLMHRYQRQPRQDRFSVVYDDASRTLVIAVCDGVSQFELSHEAAAFVAADTPRAYLNHRGWLPAVAEVNERLTRFADEAALRPRLLALLADSRMATTLAAVAIRLDGERPVASMAWTDDTSVWYLVDGGWELLTQPPDQQDNGGLHSSRVRALPHPDPRVSVTERELAGGALFITTDGVGQPLRDARQVQETLAQWWATPPDIFTFARQVAFARKAHVDDRTVVGVWFDQQ